jgi:hypothetical protein
MNDDFHRKVEMFTFLNKLDLCVFLVIEGGGHGSPSMYTLDPNFDWSEVKIT